MYMYLIIFTILAHILYCISVFTPFYTFVLIVPFFVGPSDIDSLFIHNFCCICGTASIVPNLLKRSVLVRGMVTAEHVLTSHHESANHVIHVQPTFIGYTSYM